MIIVDVEATGSSKYDKCSIIELAALEFDNPSNIFHESCRAFEGAHIDEDAKRMLEVDDSFFFDKKKQSIEELMVHFMKWMEPIEDRTFAGAYITFDIAMFKTQLSRMNMEFSIGYGAIEIDTLVYAWAKKNGIKIDLYKNAIYAGISAVLKNNYVGLTIERKAHTAIEDVKLSAEIINRILYGKKLLPEYSQFNLPDRFKPLI